MDTRNKWMCRVQKFSAGSTGQMQAVLMVSVVLSDSPFEWNTLLKGCTKAKLSSLALEAAGFFCHFDNWQKEVCWSQVRLQDTHQVCRTTFQPRESFPCSFGPRTLIVFIFLWVAAWVPCCSIARTDFVGHSAFKRIQFYTSVNCWGEGSAWSILTAFLLRTNSKKLQNTPLYLSKWFQNLAALFPELYMQPCEGKWSERGSWRKNITQKLSKSVCCHHSHF